MRFAIRTTDAAWIARNHADVDDDGRARVTLPAEQVERVTFAGVPMLRHVFADVPRDFPNGVAVCPVAWVTA